MDVERPQLPERERGGKAVVREPGRPRPAMDEERSHLTKRPSEGKAVVRDYAPRTKIGRVRGKYSGKGQEYCRDGGQQRIQGQDEAEHQRGGETRSSIKMVDRNNGSVKVVSLSDIFSSS